MSRAALPWFSPVEEALCVASSDSIEWQSRADLVVVGFGGAGVTAAIEALDSGASVIAIDRYEGGGATTMSGGIVYLGGGTDSQREAGVDDSPEAMFDYLKMETEGVVSDETLRKFCLQSPNNTRWLEDNGVEFSSALSPVKTSYPGSKSFLYYSGNETVPAYAARAKPAVRGHRAFGRGLSGASFYTPLKKSALEKGVLLRTQSRVRRLIVDESGAVLGLELQYFFANSREQKYHRLLNRIVKRIGTNAPPLSRLCRQKLYQMEQQAGLQRETVRAEKGVVLAAGGFIMNREMVHHHAPDYTAGLPLGDSGCDGSGIHLGGSVGAAVGEMDNVSAWRFINPPFAWAKGIVVNAQGRRYCNEQVYGSKLGHHMVKENDGRALLIISREMFWQAIRQSCFGGLWLFQAAPALLNLLLNTRKAKTLEELARKCVLPEGNLVETVRDYNQAAQGEMNDKFGKSADFIEGLFSGPYYALDISLDSPYYPCPTLTLGGLKVDERTGQVVDEDNKVIVGLYAAGRCAVGVASHLYVSGLSLADCVFSGRRAGHYCARQAAPSNRRD